MQNEFETGEVNEEDVALYRGKDSDVDDSSFDDDSMSLPPDV